MQTHSEMSEKMHDIMQTHSGMSEKMHDIMQSHGHGEMEKMEEEDEEEELLEEMTEEEEDIKININIKEEKYMTSEEY
ncbi:hypothetical protein M8J76_007533 [Diaphorina citri]|nr:hypothetical protein M8J75_015592 [Diaphorina citri]KAI5733086.1 hypothetical protein M8J76_007533 [Diaphorina citri]